MVNVGGPSKGCLTCIQRKIRCDRQRPVCGQCQKSKRQCGGYRNTADIMFRNQSRAASTGASAASHTRVTTRNTQNSDDSRSTSADFGEHAKGLEHRASVMIHSPKLNEESGLIHFFTNNFTCSDSSRGSNLLWIPNNFDDLLKVECVRFSTQSVGAMALARLQRSAHYFRQAQKNYGLALLCLNEFWQQHIEVVKDATMITILFLGFFEILASYDDSSRQSWTTHLGGLGHLLNMRKQQFLEGGFGARMLLQSRSQAIINALQTKTPVAEVFQNPAQRLHRSMLPTLVQSDNADMLLIRLATLQAQHQVSGPSNVLASALTTLDDDICRWMEDVPTSWSFSTQLLSVSSELWWDVRYDIYPTALTAHVWNKMRAARIIVHDLVQEISVHLPSYHGEDIDLTYNQADCETLTPKTRRLVTDICATIPVCYRPVSANVGPDGCGNKPLLGTTYWLLWPLEVVGSMREAPPSLREWVRQCFERIYELTGIVKAQIAAQRLRVSSGGSVVL